jgi:hypothetical protein
MCLTPHVTTAPLPLLSNINMTRMCVAFNRGGARGLCVSHGFTLHWADISLHFDMHVPRPARRPRPRFCLPPLPRPLLRIFLAAAELALMCALQVATVQQAPQRLTKHRFGADLRWQLLHMLSCTLPGRTASWTSGGFATVKLHFKLAVVPSAAWNSTPFGTARYLRIAMPVWARVWKPSGGILATPRPVAIHVFEMCAVFPFLFLS